MFCNKNEFGFHVFKNAASSYTCVANKQEMSARV